MTDLEGFYRFNEWASGRLLDALRAMERPSARALRAFGHLLAAERIWLLRIRGEDDSGIELAPEWTVEECAARLAENLAGWRAFLEGGGAADLAAPITYRNTKGVEYRTPLGEILAHVLLHGAYHRGQVAAWIRVDGGEPSGTDYIVYVRQRPPRES